MNSVREAFEGWLRDNGHIHHKTKPEVIRLGDGYGSDYLQIRWEHYQQTASMQEEIERLANKCERLKQEAILHHGEDTAHKSTLFDIYHHIGTQKGDWNGSKPVIEYIQQLQAEVEALKEWQGLADNFLMVKRSHCGHLVNSGYVCHVCGADPSEPPKE